MAKCKLELAIGNTFTLATFSPLRRPEAEEAGGGGRGRDGVGAARVEGERGGVGAGEVVRGEEGEVEADGVRERGREDERRAVGGEGDAEQRRVLERARRLVEGVAEDVVDAECVGFVPRAGDAVRDSLVGQTVMCMGREIDCR